MIKLDNLNKLKKGDKINIGNGKYNVEKLEAHMDKNDDGNFKESKEIILTKVGEKPKVLLKKRYVLRTNKKSKEIKFYKLIQEKNNFPEGFKFKQRGMWTSYKEIKS